MIQKNMWPWWMTRTRLSVLNEKDSSPVMNTDEWTLSGHVVQGTGKAGFFTRLEWVRKECLKTLRFVPFPGTLNLETQGNEPDLLDALPSDCLKELVSPDPAFCSARVCPVRVGHVRGALILPADDVNVHDRHVLEILAPVRLRHALDLRDGDRVEVRLEKTGTDPGTLLQLDGALFDLDGTLIDSVESYYRIVETALVRLGFPSVPRKVILQAARQDQFNWDRVLPEVPGESRKETIQKAWHMIETLYPELFLADVTPFPETGPVLSQIHGAGIRMAIVTSTPDQSIKGKLKILDQAGVTGLVEQVITAGDAARKKPFPDPLILCRERMGLSADRCVYVGDMGIDITAGRAAGMKTIGVLTGFESRVDLQQKGPDLILSSIAGLPGALGLKTGAGIFQKTVQRI